MAKERRYKVRRPWKGEQNDFQKVGHDAREEFKGLEVATAATDEAITRLEEDVAALQAQQVIHLQREAQKTDTGTAFSQTTWTDLPGTGGSGTGGSQGGGETSDDGGCGCRVPAGGSGSTGPWLAAFLAAAAALRRRVTPRRRAEASST